MLATARAMLLSLLRDRASLAMDFALPPLMFFIFAAIFASATGTELRLHVGFVDLVRSPETLRLTEALRGEPGLRVTILNDRTVADLRKVVRNGVVDVGIAVRSDLSGASDSGQAPIVVVEDAARSIAVPIVIGQLQKTLNEKLPDLALARILRDVESAGAISKDERSFLDEAFRVRAQEQQGSGFAFAPLVERLSSAEMGRAGGAIAYYAGAITVVFLLFSAMQGSTSFFDEREAGIYERLLASPRRLSAIIYGKFLFTVAKGVVQALLIFSAAWLVYGVDIISAWPAWIATCLLVSAMAAGLSLGICSICATRQQVELSSTFGVLLLSAVGGSMVPRFLMPEWLKNIGWLTPNTWGIEAFQGALRTDPIESNLIWHWLVLIGIGVGGLVIAKASIKKSVFAR